MALIITKQEEYTYIPLTERGDKKPFTVTFKRLDVRALAALEDGFVNLKGENNISLQQGSYNYKAVKTGITSWINLTDGKTDYPVKTNKRSEVLDECLDLLPANMLTEIATVIVGVSKDPANAEDFLGNE